MGIYSQICIYVGPWHKDSWEPLTQRVCRVWKLIKTEGSTPPAACPLKSSLSWTWWVPRTPLSNHPVRQTVQLAIKQRHTQMQSRETKCLFTLPVNSTRVGRRMEGRPLGCLNPWRALNPGLTRVPEPPHSPRPPALQPHWVRANPPTLLQRFSNGACMNSSRGLKGSSVPWARAFYTGWIFTTCCHCFEASFRTPAVNFAIHLRLVVLSCASDKALCYPCTGETVKLVTFVSMCHYHIENKFQYCSTNYK